MNLQSQDSKLCTRDLYPILKSEQDRKKKMLNEMNYPK